jgi:hypothetical protein
MRKKCERNCSFAVQRCDPLDENNDFTPGVESQTLSLWPSLT